MDTVTIQLRKVQDQQGNRYYWLLSKISPAEQECLRKRGLQLVHPKYMKQMFGVSEGVGVYIKRHDDEDLDHTKSIVLEGKKIVFERGFDILQSMQIIFQEVQANIKPLELDPFFKSEWFQNEKAVLTELRTFDATYQMLLAWGLPQ